MKQSKKHSLYESLANTGVGFILSVLAWEFIVAPFIGFDKEGFGDGIGITLFFTVLSVVRNYYIRRYFNWVKRLPKWVDIFKIIPIIKIWKRR